MNKTAIKNFAIWARNKLIADITYKAGLVGITKDGIKAPLPQSTKDMAFFDIGMTKPSAVSGKALEQRRRLVKHIEDKAAASGYKAAYSAVVEETAYTWFNRLIAVRFMEVNDYLPSHIRVLSSGSETKLEPDLVTTPFDAGLAFTDADMADILALKEENDVDGLFRMLFIKQCNALNAILPKLFEKTEDYTELLLNVSVTDKDGVVHRLIHDIPEEDFNIRNIGEDGKPTGQVEIIGWLYQYYIEERKNQVINIYKGIVKKEDIPAATQLFTTDWVVKYIVDNSLGRYWIERNPNSRLKEKLTYYVTPKNDENRYIDEHIDVKDLTVLDPCMGSAHFLVYAFEVLMFIYQECGYAANDAAKSILENNLYGLDIDDRAFQLAYFAVMMKARQYNRRILNRDTVCHVYSIQESNSINRDLLRYFGSGLSTLEKNDAETQMNALLDLFANAKEYGSTINVETYNWELLRRYAIGIKQDAQISIDSIGIEEVSKKLQTIIDIGWVMAKKYPVVVTNPPYLNKMDDELKQYVNKNYKAYSGDLFSVFVFRNFRFCQKDGYTGFMTPFVWMFIKTYEQLRNFVIKNKSITTLVQMEYSAFEEATVPICSFIMKNGKETEKGLYFKLSEFKGGMEVQRKKVLEAIANKECGYFFETSLDNFNKIPGAPLAYWVSTNIIVDFINGKPFNGDTKKGVLTGNDAVFVRYWFEVLYNRIGFNCFSHEAMLKSKKKWFPKTGGGFMRKWYGNLEDVVNLENDGASIKANVRNYRLRDSVYYMREAISWTEVSSGIFSCRYVPQGILFGNGGPVSFFRTDLEYTLGLLNTKITMLFLQALAPTINFGPEQISKIPFIYFTPDGVKEIVRAQIAISRNDWDSDETSWDFQTHPLLNCRVEAEREIPVVRGNENGTYLDTGTEVYISLENAYKHWQQVCNANFTQLKSNEEELNRIFIEIYGLQEELTPDVVEKDVTVHYIADTKEAAPEGLRNSNYLLTKKDVVISLISYAVGCMFGRYSLDTPGLSYAGGEWDAGKYTSFIPDQDNILPITDEEYFTDDITGLFCAWLKKAYGANTLEENLDFIADALGGRGKTSREVIRNYFINDFYKDHCQTYKKRPIYWLFDSGKQNGFKALIYMHRYNENTIGNLRVDYLHRMERVYENELTRMQDVIANSADARDVAAATKRKEKLQKQLKECKDYDEKIAHLALARIAIDLDDGVKVNYEKVQTGADGKKYEVLGKV